MKIFVLLPRFPYPLEKGDKLRAYNQLQQLSKNHEIHLCALSDIAVKPAYIKAVEPICKSIHIVRLPRISIYFNLLWALFSGRPLQVGYFYNRKAKQKIHQLIAEIKPDHIYCQLIRVAEYMKDVDILKTLDYQDVFSKGVERRMRNAPFYWKPVLNLEYKRLLKYEYEAFSLFDNKTIISKPDRDFIPHPEKNKIEIVINGVDTNFFSPLAIEKKYDLVFIGNMGYPPNVNASEYLVKEILPIVLKTKPDIKLMLAGATPHHNVLALQGENVHVTGWVEDIRECYAKAKIFIAPMQIGTGLQNKLLEAMAMKIPCITSSLANFALEAKEGEEILVGNSPQEYADYILYLLDNTDQRKVIANNGYLFVQRNYKWNAATKKLENLIIGQ